MILILNHPTLAGLPVCPR